ncbi:MAG: hypothetical protein COA43_14495 [Robiginitomaculum sp.]|nr:MAG: hypothetical protein COA43_14495 [Robiginitomaculum sp.]
MSEIKQAANDILAHPKVALGITAFFTSHLWLDYGEPLVRGVGTILGLVVVFMVIYKIHLEIKVLNEKLKDNNKQ